MCLLIILLTTCLLTSSGDTRSSKGRETLPTNYDFMSTSTSSSASNAQEFGLFKRESMKNLNFVRPLKAGQPRRRLSNMDNDGRSLVEISSLPKELKDEKDTSNGHFIVAFVVILIMGILCFTFVCAYFLWLSMGTKGESPVAELAKLIGNSKFPAAGPNSQKNHTNGTLESENKKKRRTPMRNVTILKSTMHELANDRAITKILELLESCTTHAQIAYQLKEQFDQMYQGDWHCIVGRDFTSTFSDGSAASIEVEIDGILITIRRFN